MLKSPVPHLIPGLFTTRLVSLGTVLALGWWLFLPASAAVPSSVEQETAVLQGDNPAFTVPLLPSKPLEALTLHLTPVPLTAKLLQPHFTAFALQITNPGSTPIQITEGAVTNGVSPEEAYKTSHKKLIGITSFIGVSRVGGHHVSTLPPQQGGSHRK